MSTKDDNLGADDGKSTISHKEDTNMVAKLLKDLKRGEWFTRKPIEEPTESQVYIKGEYDRVDKKYYCQHWDDVNNEIFLKGSTKVYVDFTF